MRAIVSAMLLVACCSDVDDTVYLGCATIGDNTVCAYCVDGLVEVTGAEYGPGPYVRCEDWCKCVGESYEFEGCERYRRL